MSQAELPDFLEIIVSKIPVVIGRVRSILNREKGSYEIRERVVKLIAVDDCLGTKICPEGR